MPPLHGRPILVFDGDCGFCRRWITHWKDITGDRVTYIPFQDAGQWVPELPEERLKRAICLVEPDESLHSGAAAVFTALATVPSHRWLRWAYQRLPGFATITEACYRQIAARRMFLSRWSRRLTGHTAAPSTHFLTRWLFLRGLGAVYLLAFLSLWPQLGGLLGPDGILPAAAFLARAEKLLGTQAYSLIPTLAWLHPGGLTLQILCGAGILAGGLLMAGVAPGLCLALAWVLYLSLVSVGQDFFSFQWDALLLETGFLSFFLSPPLLRPGPGLASPPARSVLWLLRWLLFRLMFSSGLVKLLSGDPTWRDLTALTYHYETQPLPTPLAWYAHQLPVALHKGLCGTALLLELVVPFLIFTPRRLRLIPLACFALLQMAIAATGNYGYFNLLTLLLLVPLLDDDFLRCCLPDRYVFRLPMARRSRTLRRRWPLRTACACLALLGLTVMTARFTGRASLPSPAKSLLRVLAPFQVVNSYGLFAVMTTHRPEIIIEGSNDGEHWSPYAFRWKPGDLHRAPSLVAPHMPRLDWQMWFAALGNARSTRWFSPFMARLLEGSPAVLGLMDKNPFPDHPPRLIRARLFDYSFTRRQAPDRDGRWWDRRFLGMYTPPAHLRHH